MMLSILIIYSVNDDNANTIIISLSILFWKAPEWKIKV